MKTARKPARRTTAARRALPLSLTMRVERLEKAVLFKKIPATSESAAAISAVPRFINLDADGKPTTGDHVAVYQTETDLIWTAAPLRDGADMTHAEAIRAPSALHLLGRKDWRSPVIRELLSIIDYDRCEPAVDPAHFKGPYGWTASATIAKAPAGYAWFVSLDGGISYRLHRVDLNHALAVCAGQQLGLRL